MISNHYNNLGMLLVNTLFYIVGYLLIHISIKHDGYPIIEKVLLPMLSLIGLLYLFVNNVTQYQFQWYNTNNQKNIYFTNN